MFFATASWSEAKKMREIWREEGNLFPRLAGYKWSDKLLQCEAKK